MLLKKWEQLPPEMQTDEVRRYYDILKKKQVSLLCQRALDIVASLLLLIVLSPLFLVLALAIKIDSKGPVFYRQIRVTQYRKTFRIFKFRSMTQNADQGASVTLAADARVTRVGKFVRKYRLDEISQLINVLKGEMTLVGTRPEIPKYVQQYSAEMMATLLLPAGVTGLASILFKDEAKHLKSAQDVDKVYVETILPEKMYYNLKEIEGFGFWNSIKILCMTVFAVCGKEYAGEYRPAGESQRTAETVGKNES